MLHGKNAILSLLLFFGVIALIASIAILANVPPVSKDALVHHLAVPKLYLQNGGIYEIPNLPFPYYPMNLDLLFSIPLYFGNDIAPKFIHFSFGLLTGCLIYGYLKKRLGIIYGLFGGLFFLSIPIIVKLSTTVYVDLGLIFFSTASLILLFRWQESDFHTGNRYLILSGIFCGMAMGTKYNGLITFFLLTSFVCLLYSRNSPQRDFVSLRTVGKGLLFALIALILFSPWLIRNFLWIQNPIYPIFDGWFNPQSGIANDFVSIFAIRSQIYGESWWNIALLPLRVFFEGQDGNPQYFDGRLNPFLLVLPAFAFYQLKLDSEKLKTEKVFFLFFAVLYFAFGFFGRSLRIRYIAPIIPPLVILSMFGMRNILTWVVNSKLTKRIWMRNFVFVALPVAFVWPNTTYIYQQFKEVKPFSYLSGAVTRDEYIEQFRPEYSAMRYINENLPSNSEILFIFIGKRGYYCDRSYLLDMIHRRSTLQSIVLSSNDPKAVGDGLKELGISHLLIRHDLFNEWVKEQFTPEKLELLNAFWDSYVERLFSKGGYGVYELRSSIS